MIVIENQISKLSPPKKERNCFCCIIGCTVLGSAVFESFLFQIVISMVFHLNASRISTRVWSYCRKMFAFHGSLIFNLFILMTINSPKWKSLLTQAWSDASYEVIHYSLLMFFCLNVTEFSINCTSKAQSVFLLSKLMFADYHYVSQRILCM